jgi:kinesin family protein 11
MKDIAIQMQALDDFVTRARSQNALHQDSHIVSLAGFSSTVKNSYDNIGSHFTTTYERVKDLGEEMSFKTGSLHDALLPLDTTLRQPLAELRSNIASTLLQEYAPTGETPRKTQYQYPTSLPRTEPHENLLAALRKPALTITPQVSSVKTIPVVFNDIPASEMNEVPSAPVSASDLAPTGGLREIDINISAALLSSAPGSTVSNTSSDGEIRSFKRSITGSGLKLPSKVAKKQAVVPLEGRENSVIPVTSFSQSTGRRRSPRTQA